MASFAKVEAHASPALRSLRREVMAGVVFGTPSRSCTGSGVCMVSSMQVLERLPMPCVFVLAFVSLWGGGQLLFRFPKSGLNVPLDETHFQTGYFLVEEEFTVPRWLMRAWGKPRIRIPAGRYPVHQTIDSWVVYFLV